VNGSSKDRPSYTQLVDMYFLEHRAKLIDIAAFLDRLDRVDRDPTTDEDYRIAALRSAVSTLTDGQSNRAKRVLEQFSDPTTAPLDTPGPPATGACPPDRDTDPTHARCAENNL